MLRIIKVKELCLNQKDVLLIDSYKDFEWLIKEYLLKGIFEYKDYHYIIFDEVIYYCKKPKK